MIRLPRLMSSVLLACAMGACVVSVQDLYAATLLATQGAAAEGAAAQDADAQPAEDPATDAPATETPAAEEPAADTPATDAPATDADTPATDAPATDADAPAADADAPATDAPATDAAPEPEPEPKESSLVETVDNFWHWSAIARYDMAAAAGNRIVNSGATPEEVLAAFEQVATRRSRARAAGRASEGLDLALIRWQGIQPLREVATKLTQLINQGYDARAMDQKFIGETIERLGDNERAYRNALQRLRQSGQFAVPMMLRYLRDPAKRELHGPIRNALVDLGRLVLSPLLAATETRDNNLLIPVISVLGQIHYDIAKPYLVRAATDPAAPESVRIAVDRALKEMGQDASNDNPADLFYELGEKYYYDTAAVQAEKRSANSPVWFWDERAGLVMKPVSSAIFNEVMAMRAAQTALEMGGGQTDAASLWLAANNKREAELPADNGVDAVHPNMPPAHFYNVAMGVQRLNSVLARGLRDQNSAVSLKAIRSLQGVAGQSNLFGGDAGGGVPLVNALRFPDRTVRYEAAMAIAASLPQQPFNGQELVVPLLAEAVSQSGRPNVLLVVANEADRSRLAGELAAYNIAGGVGAAGAIAEARSLPSVDVILVASDVPDEEVAQVVRISRETPRLERTAKVIVRRTGGGDWPRQAINDQSITVTQATDAAQIAEAIEKGRQRTGGLPMDEKLANDFALRAAQLLSRLAISRGQVLDLSSALSSLLGSLGDPRPDIIKAVGDAVAMVESPQVQPALLDRAADAKNPEEVRASLYRSLASSAKFYGNQLGGQQIASLRQTVAGEQNLDVRSAAAEALGALNAPVENVAQLITEPSQGAQLPAGEGQQPAARR